MTVTVCSFRKDFPKEFGNESAYPDSAINYWLAIAALLLGTGSGSPPQVCSLTGQVQANKTLVVSAIEFGSLSCFPLLLEGEGLPENAAVLGQVSGDNHGVGVYQLNFGGTIGPENMVALGQGSGAGGNPFWGPSSLVATSPPTMLADFATEMWVAHQIVLEKQAADAARTGGDPGTKIGIISSKSVNGVSVSFDTSSVLGGSMQANAGYYNQTIYGQRFYRLMKMRGSGPIQIGVGATPPFLFFNSFGSLGASNAWAGPYPGIAPADTGFGN
jgi:hypothetical protein